MKNRYALNSDQVFLPYYNLAIQDLRTWRNRYHREEYAKKLMINTFYRAHTANFMWDELFSPFKEAANDISSFDVSKFYKAKQFINLLYTETKFTKTHTVLLNLLNQRKDVGNLNFEVTDKLVSISNNQSIEELEFTYIFNYITNELLFNWCACGMIGINKKDSFAITTGYVMDIELIYDYKSSMSILGQTLSH